MTTTFLVILLLKNFVFAMQKVASTDGRYNICYSFIVDRTFIDSYTKTWKLFLRASPCRAYIEITSGKFALVVMKTVTYCAPR